MLYYVPFNNSKVLNCREATMLLLISTQVMENSVIPSNITAEQTSTLTSLLPLYSLLISFTLNQSTLFSSHQHIAAHFSVHFRNVKTIRSQTGKRLSSHSLLFYTELLLIYTELLLIYSKTNTKIPWIHMNKCSFLSSHFIFNNCNLMRKNISFFLSSGVYSDNSSCSFPVGVYVCVSVSVS